MKDTETLKTACKISQTIKADSDGDLITIREAKGAMQIQSIGFYEWCSENKWEYWKRQDIWYWSDKKGTEKILKGSELYNIYNNQTNTENGKNN